MNILVDIGHPAHVHLFKHFAWEMQKKGHVIFFSCRDKEFESYLLEKYGFSYKSFGKKYASRPGKLWGLIEFDFKAYLAGLKFKPDVFLSHGSIYAAHAAFLMGKPHISLEDTFNFEQINLYKPFTKVILTGDYDHPLRYEKKVVSYAGYHELAYLHPNRFNRDKHVLKTLGVNENEKYVIMRFVSWKASHDIGHYGLSLQMKKKVVAKLSKYARVFISAEGELPKDLKQYQIKIPPEKLHDVLAYAILYIGEGATMASECAMQGTPAIYVNSLSAGSLEEQERYGLLCGFRNSDGVLEKALELIAMPNLKEEWQKRRQKMLADKIDVTAFMVWLIENYPESVSTMQEEPNYQYRFR